MTNITIGGVVYVVEQDTDGYWYFRTNYTQNFGKKVKLKGDYLMVWNPGNSIISGDPTLPGGNDGGDGSPYP